MRHPKSEILALAAIDAEIAPEARTHLESCPRCRSEIQSLRTAWRALSDGDPAARLPDVSAWPRVAAALGESGVPARTRQVLRPRWRIAWEEVGWRPAALAGLVLAAGLAGGHLAGRAVLGPVSDEGGAVTEASGDYASATGWSVGSLAWEYFENDLTEAPGEEGVEP